MRESQMESDNDGIFRWDQVRDPDPRYVCKTCYYFVHETSTCNNPKKQFFVHIDRKIYDYESMRCVSHELHPDVMMYLRSEFKDKSIEELKQKHNDIENELSRINDFMEIKKRYGILLQDNPFAATTGDIKQLISDEIDLDLDFKLKRSHPVYGYLLQIDAATLEKVNQNTMWITGFARKNATSLQAIHHSFLNTISERFIIKQHQLSRVVLIKNGHRICATIPDFITLMQNPDLIDRYIAVDNDNFMIAQDIWGFLHSFVISTHVPFPRWNKSFMSGIGWNHTFTDLSSFKQVFKCFETDYSVKLDFALTGERDNKAVEIVQAGYLNGMEFVKLIDDLRKFLDSRKIACQVCLNEDDKAIIEEIKSIS
jgi:hypothetical protein